MTKNDYCVAPPILSTISKYVYIRMRNLSIMRITMYAKITLERK